MILLKRDGISLQSPAGPVGLKFLGANPNPKIEGAMPQPGHSNYLLGNDPSEWRTNATNYSRVHYGALYPGIDLVYYGNQRQLEYDLVVAPGTDPKAIVLQFDGGNRPRLSSEGDLLLLDEVRLLKPRAYQVVDGVQKEIPSRYILERRNRVAFVVGRYDHSFPLVIDPVLSYATYLGGSSDEEAYAVATDSSGNAYVTGYTASVDFPATSGAYKTANQGGASDVFVAKFSPTGALVYATYLGGSGDDTAYGIAVDSSNEAYITGSTTSTNFPTTTGAYRTAYRGGASDAFVAKLNAAGNGLVYSTYLGGSGDDIGYAVALDSGNEATVTGSTSSADFPASTGAYRTANGGGITDAFVTRLNAAGTALVYSTYLGGSGEDVGYGVAVDVVGNAYVTGYTQSTNFPTTAGAAQTANAGDYDVFVTALNPSGTVPVYSTLLGGSQQDYGVGIAVDNSGNAYVTGYTASSDYPHTSGVLQPGKSSGYDAIVTKLTSFGTIAYSTFLGGSADDYGLAIAVDSAGNAYITGDTASTDFPKTSDAIQTTVTGGFNAFVTRLNATGTALGYSTYVGGSGFETGYGIALDLSGAAYVAGYTVSPDFPVTSGSAQATLAGGSDAFLVKIAQASVLSVSVTHSGNFTQGQNGATYTVTVSNSASAGPTSGTVTVTETVPTGLTLVSMAGAGWTCPGTAANNCTRSDALAAGQSYPITVTVNVAANAPSQVTNQVSVSGGGSADASFGDATTINQPVAVAAVSVTPSSGSGSTPSFAAVYSDGNGYADLTWTRLQLAPTTGSGGVCDVGYLRTINMFYLVNDAGNGWLGPIAANSSSTLQNSQCVLSGSGSSAVGSGNGLTVTASLSFKSSFAGAKTIYLYATGSTGLTSGWVSRGTWTAVGAVGVVAVTADSVTPSSGSGSTPSFAAVYSDGNGYADLTWTRLQMVSTTGSGGVCDVGYMRTINMFYLVNDAGNGWLGPIAANSPGTLQNSQCALNGSGSSAAGSGNSLTVTASLSFKLIFYTWRRKAAATC